MTRASRRRTLLQRAPLPALGLLAAAACVTDKVTGKRRFAIAPWSLEQEQRIGDQAAPNFEQQYGGSLPDPAAQQHLGGLVREMTGHSVRRDDFSWQFEILNSSEPNAFALPGGYVYITRGLLENLESEGEFVAILGHEIGHVEHRHSMLQQNKAIAAAVLVGLIGVGEDLLKKDPDRPGYVSALAGAAAPLALLHYSRAQESEADARGIHFAHAMGYDPREMKMTFQYFERLEREAGSSTPPFLRSHPTNASRIGEIEQTIRRDHPEVFLTPPERFRAPPLPDDRFVQIVASLRRQAPAWRKHDQALALLAKSDGDAAKLDPARQLADEALRALPDEPLLECLAGEIRFAQGRGDQGRARFERARSRQLARAAGREYWKPAFYLGLLELQAGRGAAAAASLRQAGKLYPAHPLVAYYLGRAEELDQSPEAAAGAYARAVELSPEGSELHRKSAERLAELRGRRVSPASRGTS